MILVTGGAYAGKTAYVQEKFDLPAEKMIDGGICHFSDALTAECIQNYHLLVRRLLTERQDPLKFTETLLRINPECIIIINEIGCGIIPLEKEERIWREQVGWCGCLLAKYAQAVIRICCGCAEIIKGEMV